MSDDSDHVDEAYESEGNSSTDFGPDSETEEGSIYSVSDDELDLDDLSDDAEATTTTTARSRRRYTEVASYATYEEALGVLESWDGSVYVYETRYETRRRHTRVYICHSHVGCDHRMRLTSIAEGEEVYYTVSQGGQHNLQTTGIRRRGIHPQLRDEVDTLLNLGWGGQELKTMLEHRYASNPAVAALIPTARQLTNRKVYLTRHAPGGWDLLNFASFNAWASGRMCTTRELFDEVSDVNDPRMDELIILDSFVFDADGEADQPTFGVIVTSRRVFRNVVTAVRDQGRELVCSTDGTYKLHFGGWTVVDCGSVAITWTRQTYTHRFIPWAYMFVRSESTAAYTNMFQAIKVRAETFFAVDVAVAYGTLDHSDAIASAFEHVWPRIRLLTCWPHLARQARKKRSLLADPDLYDAMIKPQLQLLETSRSHAQFLRMSVIVTTAWIDAGERQYADWFRSTYLVRRWERWHINAAGIASIVPSQQPIEAHHRVIKRTCVRSTRASTSGVMSGVLPRILRTDGETLCPPTVGLFCAGPLPPEMLTKAQRLVDSNRNYRRVHQGRGRRKRLVSVVFNASRHLVGRDGANGNIIGADVDVGRTNRFLNSLNGEIPDGISAGELAFEVLSLHQVTIARRVPNERFELTPEWSVEAVGEVRRLLTCTCKSYVRSGWVCSHVLATLSFLGLLNLSSALSRVPVRRAPGRPPARRAALQADDPHEGYFDTQRLTRLFLRRPGQPLRWRLVDDFEVEVNDDTETSTFIGSVVALRLADGIFVWSARFEEGDLREYTADELATAVHRAHALGVNVTQD